jgi:hypothetical protein
VRRKRFDCEREVYRVFVYVSTKGVWLYAFRFESIRVVTPVVTE